jgi:type IV pilus assembly protein PilQ
VVVAGLIASAANSPAQTAAEGAKDQLLPSERPGILKEFHMRDAELRGVLELLSRQHQINIIATKDVSGKVAAVDLYDVSFEEALAAVVRATGFAYYKEGETIYVCTAKELADMQKALLELEVRTFRLSYVSANDAKTLITPLLSSDGNAVVSPAAAVGIATSKSDAGGNSYAADDVLVVKDYEENLDKIEQVIKEIDVRPDQVLIEATILRVTLDENNALGIDFNVLSGVDFSDLDSTTDGLQNVVTGDEISTGGIEGNKATFRTDFNAAVDPGGMTIGFVSNKIAFFIRALESVTDTTVLANPKLLVINKQRGEVMVGRRDGYLTTTITETTATQTVEFLETGTRLVVRPFIARDQYVRLELHPEDSSGQVEQVGNSALPSETTTEVTSNVLVRDGHTIVIGGLFRERTSAGRSQVPVVGNIPYLGTLFRQTGDETLREEVVILITPHIITRPVDEIVSEQLKDDVERYRIGARQGLRWWGRDRLVQAYMRWAKQELRKGEYQKALWNIDMVLSTQPQMIEAIRLKERLTRETYWAEQSQHSTAKYVIQRMIMQGLNKPVERVIPPRKPRDGASLPADVRRALGIGGRPEDPLPGAPGPSDTREVEPEPMDEPEESDGETGAAAPTRPGVTKLTDLADAEPAAQQSAEVAEGQTVDQQPVASAEQDANAQPLEAVPAAVKTAGGEPARQQAASEAAEAAEAEQAQGELNPVAQDVAGEDDGWGFATEAEGPAASEPGLVEETPAGEADGWGFATEAEGPAASEPGLVEETPAGEAGGQEPAAEPEDATETEEDDSEVGGITDETADQAADEETTSKAAEASETQQTEAETAPGVQDAAEKAGGQEPAAEPEDATETEEDDSEVGGITDETADQADDEETTSKAAGQTGSKSGAETAAPASAVRQPRRIEQVEPKPGDVTEGLDTKADGEQAEFVVAGAAVLTESQKPEPPPGLLRDVAAGKTRRQMVPAELLAAAFF